MVLRKLRYVVIISSEKRNRDGCCLADVRMRACMYLFAYLRVCVCVWYICQRNEINYVSKHCNCVYAIVSS